TKYGLSADEAAFFSKHHEADLEEHDEGSIGHGQLNRITLQRLLETGQAWERPTYGIEYCALAFTDLHGPVLQATPDAARRRRLARCRRRKRSIWRARRRRPTRGSSSRWSAATSRSKASTWTTWCSPPAPT